MRRVIKRKVEGERYRERPKKKWMKTIEHNMMSFCVCMCVCGVGGGVKRGCE